MKWQVAFVFLVILVAIVTVVNGDITGTPVTVSSGDCVCTTTRVNARQTAGLSGTIALTLDTGECATIEGGVVNADGYQWFEITYISQRLWVAGNYLSAAPNSSCGGGSPLSAGGRTCHGDIMNLNPTGKSTGGVPASIQEVSYDLNALQSKRDCYETSADKYCIQASLIAAIASKESGGGTTLVNGWGDNGRAWGIMQCDIYSAGLPCTDCDWDSCCHIEMAVAQELVPYINQVKIKHPDWTQDMALQGGVAAYNFGVSNVQTWTNLDVGTGHNDYSNDVIARAQWLYAHGWN